MGELMKNILLVGNSNVGKTTLFNTIAKCDEHVGNWAGVTVDIKQAKTNEFNLFDLPGIYSLDCFSMEEKVAKDFLLLHKDDYIINVIECKNLSRNLFLTLQLIELGLSPVIFLNMANEVEKQGGQIKAKHLSAILGVQVFVVDARDKTSCQNALKQLKKTNPNKLPYDLNDKDIDQKRYQYIDSFADKVLIFNQKQSKLQNILFYKWIFLLSFVAIFGFIFWLCFAGGGIGVFLSLKIEKLISFAKTNAELLLANCPLWLTSFVVDVVIDGVGMVAKFLPQIVLLFFCIGLLEDTGYISYVAFYFDGIMSKLGLDGKSVFTFLLCFGCNTSAVATSKNLGDKNIQKRTLLLATFFPCSAKMPVFLTILAFSSSVLKTGHFFILLMLYFVCFAVFVFMAKLFCIFADKPQQNFVLEISSLRIPLFKRVCKNLLKNTKEFVTRLVGTLFLCVALIWLLKSFDTGFNFVTNGVENSILAQVGKRLCFVFKPIGLDDWRICISLILGIFAKEVVAGSLVLLFGSSFAGVLSWQATICFLLFVALYMPCVSTMAMIKKECGSKTALTSVLLNTSTAWIICFVFYSFSLAFAKSFIFGIALCICITFVAISVVFVLKYKCKNCKGCKSEDFTMQK